MEWWGILLPLLREVLAFYGCLQQLYTHKTIVIDNFGCAWKWSPMRILLAQCKSRLCFKCFGDPYYLHLESKMTVKWLVALYDKYWKESLSRYFAFNIHTKYSKHRQYRLLILMSSLKKSRSRGPGFDSWRYQIFWKVVGVEQGPLSLVSQLRSYLEEIVAAMVYKS
jgi:hypothetical protein